MSFPDIYIKRKKMMNKITLHCKIHTFLLNMYHKQMIETTLKTSNIRFKLMLPKTYTTKIRRRSNLNSFIHIINVAHSKLLEMLKDCKHNKEKNYATLGGISGTPVLWASSVLSITFFICLHVCCNKLSKTSHSFQAGTGESGETGLASERDLKSNIR